MTYSFKHVGDREYLIYRDNTVFWCVKVRNDRCMLIDVKKTELYTKRALSHEHSFEKRKTRPDKPDNWFMMSTQFHPTSGKRKPMWMSEFEIQESLDKILIDYRYQISKLIVE